MTRGIHTHLQVQRFAACHLTSVSRRHTHWCCARRLIFEPRFAQLSFDIFVELFAQMFEWRVARHLGGDRLFGQSEIRRQIHRLVGVKRNDDVLCNVSFVHFKSLESIAGKLPGISIGRSIPMTCGS